MNFELSIKHENKALENLFVSNFIQDIEKKNEINFIKEEGANYKTRDIPLSLIFEIIGGILSVINIAELIYKYVFEKNITITISYGKDNLVITPENVTKDIIESFLKKHIND